MGQLGLGDDEAEVLVPTLVKAPGGMRALQVPQSLPCPDTEIAKH